MAKRTYHCCPSHCVDDLCVSSDQGLCGGFRCDDPLDSGSDHYGWDDEDEPAALGPDGGTIGG